MELDGISVNLLLAASASVRLVLVILGGSLLFIVLPALVMLIRGMRKARQQHQRLNLKCHHCGYDRIGHLATTTCPECGGELEDFLGRYGLNESSNQPADGNRSDRHRVS